MGRPIDTISFNAALVAADINNYVTYDLPELCNVLTDENNPLSLLERKEEEMAISERYKEMSDEAKQIIEIVLNSPREMAEVFFTPNGRWGKASVIRTRLVTYLAKKWQDRAYAKKTVREIESFVELF